MKIAASFASLVLASAGISDRQSADYAAIVFENNTSVVGDMHVDGMLECRATAGSSCTAVVRAGMHSVEFVFADDVVVRSPAVFVEPGAPFTIPVREPAGTSAREPHGAF